MRAHHRLSGEARASFNLEGARIVGPAKRQGSCEAVGPLRGGFQFQVAAEPAIETRSRNFERGRA
jgi:hypothetical protein